MASLAVNVIILGCIYLATLVALCVGVVSSIAASGKRGKIRPAYAVDLFATQGLSGLGPVNWASAAVGGVCALVILGMLAYLVIVIRNEEDSFQSSRRPVSQVAREAMSAGRRPVDRRRMRRRPGGWPPSPRARGRRMYRVLNAWDRDHNRTSSLWSPRREPSVQAMLANAAPQPYSRRASRQFPFSQPQPSPCKCPPR